MRAFFQRLLVRPLKLAADLWSGSEHQDSTIIDMPIYEYQCESCGHSLEALQKISDAPLLDCPACGAANLQKLVSAASFRLKGGGWYETDFKTGDKKQLADTGGDSKVSDSKSSETESKATDSKGDKPSQSNVSESKSAGNANSRATTKSS